MSIGSKIETGEDVTSFVPTANNHDYMVGWDHTRYLVLGPATNTGLKVYLPTGDNAKLFGELWISNESNQSVTMRHDAGPSDTTTVLTRETNVTMGNQTVTHCKYIPAVGSETILGATRGRWAVQTI